MNVSSMLLNVLSILGAISLCECISESKRTPWQKGIAWGFCFTITLMIALLCHLYLSSNTTLYYSVILITCMFAFMATCFYLYEGSILQLFFSFFIQLDAFLLVVYIGKAIAYYFFDGNVWVEVFMRLLGFIGICLLYGMWFRKVYLSFAHNKKYKSIWAVLLSIAVLFAGWFYFVLLYPVPLYYKEPYHNIEMVLGMGIFMVIYIGMISVLTSLEELLVFRENKQKEEAKRRYWEAQVKMQNDAFEKVRRLKHDLRHHVVIIKEMIDQENYEKADEYLATLGAKIESTNTQVYCKNYVVNSLLSVYIQKALDAGIEVENKINIPENIPIDELEFAGLMANLIENATEACLRMPSSAEKFIKINVQYQPNSFKVLVENSCNNKVVFDGPFPVSTKTGEHGIGTKSVAKAALKYKGLVDYSEKDGVFTARVILNF